LVPIDFSKPSLKALDQAVTFARQFKARLTLLHVVEPIATPDFASSFPLAIDIDRMLDGAKSRLKELAEAPAIPPGTVKTSVVRYGRSFHEIAEVARESKTDLIIIATHGYTGLRHMLLGSTAERVVRHAPCPVLVLR
jgi:nucleotide-binding universal stress UspA family protein